MPAFVALIPSIISLLLPAAESALGASATVDQKHDWIVAAVHDIFSVVLSKVKAPSWVALIRDEIEKLVEAELDKVLGKIGG